MPLYYIEHMDPAIMLAMVGDWEKFLEEDATDDEAKKLRQHEGLRNQRFLRAHVGWQSI